MEWTDIIKPNGEVFHTHVKAKSPLGEFVIWWDLRRKIMDPFIVLLNEEYIGCEVSLNRAKAMADLFVVEKQEELQKFIKALDLKGQ